MRKYEYTWMWGQKESTVKTYEFFIDAVKSASKHVSHSAFSWVGVCEGPKLCAGVLPGVDPLYALGLLDLTPYEVTLQPNSPRMKPMILTSFGGTTCGFRTAKYRPVVCGTDIGSLDASGQPVVYGCSAGFFAERSGQVGIISNDHCTKYTACGGRGYYITQPGPACGGTPDDVIGGPPITNSYSGEWPVDAAFVPLSVDYQLAVLDEGGQLRQPLGSARDPLPGEPAVKFGRGIYTFSTRWGSVKAIGATVGVDTGCGVITFEDQIIMSYMLSPGDSGSGLYSERMEPLGLDFAGNYTDIAASRTVLVQQELGVSILTAGPAVSTVIQPPTTTLPPWLALLVPLTASVGLMAVASPPKSLRINTQ
jgi:hypothetical protein